jgi:hypothetical protein
MGDQIACQSPDVGVAVLVEEAGIGSALGLGDPDSGGFAGSPACCGAPFDSSLSNEGEAWDGVGELVVAGLDMDME